MKKFLCAALTAAILLAALVVPSSATTTQEAQEMLDKASGTGLLIAPNPNAVPQRQGDFYVLVNGEYVTFSDAVPQIRDSRSFLPFVAVFEQLGFSEEAMTWDGETKTVTATRDAITISLTIGKQEILLTRDGETTSFPTDVAPYIDPATSRTYLPFGLVADVLGYNVGWDGDVKAVLIDDVDTLMANNTASYLWMDRYLLWDGAFVKNRDRGTGDCSYGIGATDPESALTTQFSYGGIYEMLTEADGSAFQYVGDLEYNMSFLLDGADITAEVMAAMGGTLGAQEALFPLTVQLEMRGCTDTNLLYSRSTMDPEMEDGSVWTVAPLDTAPEAMFLHLSDGLFFEEIDLNADQDSFSQVVASLLATHKATSVDTTCAHYLTYLNQVFADDSFVRSGNAYTNAIEEDGETFTLTLFAAGNRVTGYAWERTEHDPDAGLYRMAHSMKGREASWSIHLTPADESAADAEFHMEMTGTYQVTTKAPVVTPPEDAFILTDVDESGSIFP